MANFNISSPNNSGVNWILRWITIVFLFLPMRIVFSTKVFNIHWNASNPIFRIDKTDNVIDINAGNYPSEYDQVNIVCPVYKTNIEARDQERYIIYLVSKEEFESCRITQPNPRIIAVCTRPYSFMYFTITFRTFTPTPGGLEFHPGHDYYFISTSSKDDLHRRVGGGCSSHNMRLIFKVASKTNRDDNSLEEAAGGQSPKRFHPWQPTPLDPESEGRVTSENSITSSSTFYYPVRELQRSMEVLDRNEAVKKDSNILRGGRKAFAIASISTDPGIDSTSNSARTSCSILTILFPFVVVMIQKLFLVKI